jgi:pimeloyl-ACP methyl ester carboxylesterase
MFMKQSIVHLAFLLLTASISHGGPQKVPTSTSDQPSHVESKWKGFTKQSFQIEGRSAFVVVPPTPAIGRPWIWRTSFPNYHPEVDLELVKLGFHIAYLDVVAMLGADEALDRMDRFYYLVRARWGLAAKPALEPVSRGGLPAYRYAARHPQRIACIYADVPVMDLKSWPLKAPNAKGPVRDALRYYEFKSEAELKAFSGDPIDVLERIAKARIPLRHVISPNDSVVPAEENTLEARRRLQALGWDMDVVTVDPVATKNGGHHFPLPEIGASVSFIRRHTTAKASDRH